jgi:hypothetical protein
LRTTSTLWPTRPVPAKQVEVTVRTSCEHVSYPYVSRRGPHPRCTWGPREMTFLVVVCRSRNQLVWSGSPIYGRVVPSLTSPSLVCCRITLVHLGRGSFRTCAGRVSRGCLSECYGSTGLLVVSWATLFRSRMHKGFPHGHQCTVTPQESCMAEKQVEGKARMS